MVLLVKMYEGKWRIKIEKEEWEFEEETHLFKVLGFLTGFKRDYGQLYAETEKTKTQPAKTAGN